MDDRAILASALAGRYDVDREIGCGGMATVYLARDVRHARQRWGWEQGRGAAVA
jgi:serine/threonine-protein kinase